MKACLRNLINCSKFTSALIKIEKNTHAAVSHFFFNSSFCSQGFFYFASSFAAQCLLFLIRLTQERGKGKLGTVKG